MQGQCWDFNQEERRLELQWQRNRGNPKW